MHDLLAETLALWGVDGAVQADGEGYAVRVGESVARIARGRSARWIVEIGGAQHECMSVTGVLSALRLALGVEGGARLRVTP